MQNNIEPKSSYTVKELLEIPHAEIPFLWGKIIPKAGITFLTGSSDCNKSTFLRQLVLSIGARNSEFLGLPLNIEKGASIYLSTEDEHHAISALIKKQITGIDYLIDWQDKTLFVFCLDKYLKFLDDALTSVPCDIVVIDTWTDLYGEDLNQSNKVRKHLQHFSNLATKHQCAFILVHHKKKGTDDKESHKGDMLGSQGIEAKARTVIELKRDGSSNKRILRVLKGNYTPENVKNTSKVFEIDENMWLTHIEDNIESVYGLQHISEDKIKKEEIKSELYQKRESGLSFTKIHEELSSKYGDFMVSETTLKNWMKAKPVSQVIPLVKKQTD